MSLNRRKFLASLPFLSALPFMEPVPVPATGASWMDEDLETARLLQERMRMQFAAMRKMPEIPCDGKPQKKHFCAIPLRKEPTP